MDCLDYEITKNYNTWLSHARGLTKNRQDAEELLHKALMKVMESGKARLIACEQERKGSLEYYVNRTIWNTHISEQTRLKKKISIDEIGELQNAETEYNLAGEHFDILLGWLSDYERELLKMYIIPGFRIKHAAEIMGINEQTLSRHIKQAAAKLYKYVEDSKRYTTD